MMSWGELMQLEWSHPWWALLALQPVAMMLLLKLRHNQVLHYADAHLLAWVVRGSLGMRQDILNKFLNLVAWLLLGCAIAGPRLPLASDNEQQSVQRHEMDIMVVLDVSPSMMARDISPQRLQRAKLELLDLLPRLHGERLGLIAFSGSAGLVMPLSRDYAAMRYYLKLAEPALFETPGTAIASALDLAIRKMPLEKTPRAILLLTDAETSALSGPAGSALWGSAERLRQSGISLYILGVGTAAGATIPTANGNSIVDEGVDVVSRMDQAGFAELASKTNGKFVVVADGDGDWRSLYDNGLLTIPGGRQPAESVQAWQEKYAIFLLPALLLFYIIHFPVKWKWKQVKEVVLPLILFTMLLDMGVKDVNASVSDDATTETQAYAAYHSQKHTLAQALYADLHGYAARMGEGAAAYRRKDYQYAIRQFSAALLEAREVRQREQALYNLGNSYFMAGGYRAAADAFLGVLQYAPSNQDARANLALSAGKLSEIGKTGKKSQGILGRRGRETGGRLGQDASNQSLAMAADDEKKKQSSAAGRELAQDEKASLNSAEKSSSSSNMFAQSGNDSTFSVALKKLELARDNPADLHKALVKIEAAKVYIPKQEMSPW